MERRDGWGGHVIDGVVQWSSEDGRTVTGKPWAPCSHTALHNPVGSTPHAWARRDALWYCTACHRATVGRPVPVCEDGEHRWSEDPNKKDTCTVCWAAVTDIFAERGTRLGSRYDQKH